MNLSFTFPQRYNKNYNITSFFDKKYIEIMIYRY